MTPALSHFWIRRTTRRSDVLQTVPANYAGFCRRTPRHTTHHKDLPEHVTITRPQHPLEGKKLSVFGQRRFRNKLHLILTLPQGGRALIPKEWTDLEALPPDSPAQAKPHTLLGSVPDLLHARAVVDALLSRRTSQPGSDGKSINEENTHLATHAELSRYPHSGNSGMGNPARGTQKPGHRSARPTDCSSKFRESGIGGGRS